MRYRLCGRILTIVLLMSFWKIPVYGEEPAHRFAGEADNAEAEFRRKRDEAVQRIRGRHAD
jgi:hypothetical protein